MLENNIKKLIKILEESKVDELEISTFWGKQKIKIRKNAVQSMDRNIEFIQSTQGLKLPILFILTKIDKVKKSKRTSHEAQITCSDFSQTFSQAKYFLSKFVDLLNIALNSMLTTLNSMLTTLNILLSDVERAQQVVE